MIISNALDIKEMKLLENLFSRTAVSLKSILLCCRTVLLLEHGSGNCFGASLFCVFPMLKTINQLLSIKFFFSYQTVEK